MTQQEEDLHYSPSVVVGAEAYVVPRGIEIAGHGWGPCPVELTIDGNALPLPNVRVLSGSRFGDAVRTERGRFFIRLDLPDLDPGVHEVVATGEDGELQLAEARAALVIAEVPEVDDDGRPTLRPLRRIEHMRVARLGLRCQFVGTPRLEALRHRDRMRQDLARPDGGADVAAPSTVPGCNWTSIGPAVVRRGQVFAPGGAWGEAPISGRLSSLAIDPNNPSTIFAGAAQGGVWRSFDGGRGWEPRSDHEVSLAIGAVAVDGSMVGPDGRSTRVIAGTGEFNRSIDSYYGAGLLISDDGGETWSNRGGTVFGRDTISSIAIDPADSTHLFVASDVGVWESTDDGFNWTQIEPGRCHDLVVDWAHPGGPELYVGRQGIGVRYSDDGGAGWTTLSGGLPAAADRVALAMGNDPDVLYTAFASAAVGAPVASVSKSTDGGASWTPATVPASTGQAWYNLVLGVDPTDDDVVLLGEIGLWRSNDSGASWTDVSIGTPGIHADQHAIAFHPSDGSQVYVGNDGGCWYSADNGQTWGHRNRDLATLQYLAIANHPQWDSVVLGGTQDNGAQRSLGHPAWELSALGDGAYAAIDSGNTQLWYESRWSSFPLYQNAQAGAYRQWNNVAGGVVTNANRFYPPFAMDPADGQVIYVGYDELWRTTNAGGAWADLTGSLEGGVAQISAIIVAPSDSDRVFVGYSNGSVYRVQPSTGTATDITGTGLPGFEISDIVVHPTDSDTIYVTSSTIASPEGGGEFTTDHVYRTTNGGAQWNNRSAGLAQTNPVNSIVIDPANPNTIFIGCDVGVFRSTDGGGSWAAWDQALPNCAVFDLSIETTQRLLRAATHGRSIWERPLDDDTCVPTDVYLRDSVLDTGRTTPSPTGQPHPFDPTRLAHWYQSPDIKIDAPDPATNDYQTLDLAIDYLQFEDLDHDNPRRETVVRAHVQVHNRGISPAENVTVRAFFADAGGGLPPLPADFWTAFPGDPADTSVWRPIGPAQTIPVIAPARPQVTSWAWDVPADAADHSCLLVVTSCTDDPVATTALDISGAVRGDNNVALKNLHVDDFIPGAGGTGAAGPYFLRLHTADEGAAVDVRFLSGNLPPGSRVVVYLSPVRLRGGRRGGLRGIYVEESEPIEFDAHWLHCGREPIEFVTDQRYVVEVERLREGVGEIRLTNRSQPLGLAFFVELPEDLDDGRYHFQIQQWTGKAMAGGSEYELRVEKRR